MFIFSLQPHPPSSTLFPYTTLFRSRGFAATKLADVARRAGVTKGTVYLYFDSKEALFKAVVRETRSEEHTSELQSHHDLVCRLLLEKKKKQMLTYRTFKITNILTNN